MTLIAMKKSLNFHFRLFFDNEYTLSNIRSYVRFDVSPIPLELTKSLINLLSFLLTSDFECFKYRPTSKREQKKKWYESKLNRNEKRKEKKRVRNLIILPD